MPEAGAELAEMASLYQHKLWHQLTLKLDAVVKADGPLNRGDLPLRLFSHFVTDFGPRINLLKLAQFAVHATKSLPSPSAMVEHLQATIKQLEDMKQTQAAQPILFLRMHVAQHQLEAVGAAAGAGGVGEESRACVRAGVRPCMREPGDPHARSWCIGEAACVYCGG